MIAAIKGVTSDVKATTGDVALTAKSGAAIESLAVAASLAAAGGAVIAASISGAGAVATNVILTRTNANITDSDVTTTGTAPDAGNVVLLAENTSSIKAIVAAASAAVSGGFVAVGASIGVSISRNLIGWTVDGTTFDEQPAEVRAYVLRSTVDATGDLQLTATATETIEALVLAISVAIAGGAAAGAFTGAGSSSDNRITTYVKAFVEGDPAGGTTVDADAVTLKATDTSRILANVAAASIGVAAGIGVGVTVSISVSLANNLVANQVEAYVLNVERLESHVGAVSLTATTSAGPVIATSTNALLAAALQAAVIEDGKVDGTDVMALQGLLPTLGLSSVLAVTTLIDGNEWVLRDVVNRRAYVIRKIGATFDVFAVTIDAVSVAAAIGVGGGAIGGGAASGAGAVATNTVLTRTNAFVQGTDDLKSAGDVSLSATSTAAIVATVVAASIAVGVGGLGGAALSIGVAITRNSIGWEAGDGTTPNHKLSDGTRTVTTGQTVLVDAGPLTGNVYEYVGSATLTNAVLALQNFTDTTTWREVQTRSAAQVQAYIVDSSVDATGNLSLTATSRQTIATIVVAGSAAVAGGGIAGIGATGAGASAENRIAVTVAAFVDGDGDDGIKADAVTLSATDTSTIKSDVGTASIGGGFGTVGVAVSIGVALAQNTISNRIEAYVRDADTSLTARDGAVALTANESASIVSLAVAASLAVSGGPLAAVSISGAGADAKNVILTAVKAFAENSVLVTETDGADVALTATDVSTITATIVAVSASVAIGGVGVAISVGAAVARNLVGWDYVHTSASGSQAIAYGDKVRVADGYAGGGTPGAVYRYLGAAGTLDLGTQNYANTTLWEEDGPNQVKAYLDDTSVDAGGDLELSATATQVIRAVVAAGSVAVSAGGFGASGSGAGAQTINRIATLVQAYVDGDGADDITAASVSIKAHDTSSITATTAAVSVALSFTIGGAVSLAVALADNEIANQVDAFISGTVDGLTTTSGGITLEAITLATISALTVSASVAGGVGAFSGAGAKAVNTTTTRTRRLHLRRGCRHRRRRRHVVGERHVERDRRAAYVLARRRRGRGRGRGLADDEHDRQHGRSPHHGRDRDVEHRRRGRGRPLRRDRPRRDALRRNCRGHRRRRRSRRRQVDRQRLHPGIARHGRDRHRECRHRPRPLDLEHCRDRAHGGRQRRDRRSRHGDHGHGADRRHDEGLRCRRRVRPRRRADRPDGLRHRADHAYRPR